MAPIFLVAGAPAVGKSKTARVLASHFQKSIHIPVDNIRDMVASGLALPGEWTELLVEQLRLAREGAAHLARIYNKAGFAVVIDDFWDPNGQLAEYNPLFREAIVHKILLYPSQRTAEERNLKRSGAGDISEYIAGGIREVYEHLRTEAVNLERRGWLILDSSEWTVEQTAQAVLRGVSL